VYDIDLPRALEVLAMERAPRGANSVAALRTIGAHPEDGKDVTVHEGRYGPYVKHGSVNATIPKDTTPDAITLEEAIELIAARVARGPAKKPVRKTASKTTAEKKPKADKKPAAKASKPKAAKPTTAKATAKKPAAKKAPATKAKKPAA
jgi:DNA topoisomerase-1